MNNLAIKQQECLDDDTFNFLVELRLVSLGSYHTLVTIAAKDSKQAREWIKQCQRFWKPWLGDFNPNTFSIVKASRAGLL